MHNRESMNFARRCAVIPILVVLVVCTSITLPALPAHAAPGRAEPRATLRLGLMDQAGTTVKPGDMLLLNVRVENVGQSEAQDLAVRFTYWPELTLVQESSVDVVANREFYLFFGSQGVGTFNVRQVALMVRPEVRSPARVLIESELSWRDNGITRFVPGPSVVVTVGTDEGGAGTAASQTDSDAPTSRIRCLRLDGNGVTLVWEGQDATSAVLEYRVQTRRVPGGNWTTWRLTPDQKAWFGPLEGKDFAFRVQAVDAWGNVGQWSSDASTEMLRSGSVPVCP